MISPASEQYVANDVEHGFVEAAPELEAPFVARVDVSRQRLELLLNARLDRLAPHSEVAHRRHRQSPHLPPGVAVLEHNAAVASPHDLVVVEV